MPEVHGLIVPHAEVTSIRAVGTDAVADQGRHPLHVLWIHLVVPGSDHERLHLDLVQPRPDIPISHVAGHQELATALHLGVDRCVGAFESPCEAARPGLCSTEHLRVKHIHQEVLVSPSTATMAAVRFAMSCWCASVKTFPITLDVNHWHCVLLICAELWPRLLFADACGRGEGVTPISARRPN